MVIPGSAVVLILGLLAAWLSDVPITGEGNWWLTVSLHHEAGRGYRRFGGGTTAK